MQYYYQYRSLQNGIRVIHRQIPGQISHCGLMVETGSRDESNDENGMAHFIEHMIFKGTGKRKAFHLMSKVENVGGEMNAFTTKEETCIYASFLSPYYERSLDVFSDVAFHSVFPEKEIAKEKDVVLDEINSYNDSPAELIYDDFEEQLFDNHPLGRNILGDKAHVKGFHRRDIFQFVKRNYDTEKMVIASVGQIDFQDLIVLVEKYFGSIPSVHKNGQRKKFETYNPSRKILNKSSYLSHCITGNLTFARNDPRKLTLSLLNNLLGGPAMNSRLNLGIREKYGFAYSIESTVQTYSDTGWFGVYLGTDQKYIEKGLSLIDKELKMLSSKKLGLLQLHRAKQQFIGQMSLAYESPLDEMLGIAKNHLYNHRVKGLDEIVALVNTIQAEEVLAVAAEVFEPSGQSVLIYESK